MSRAAPRVVVFDLDDTLYLERDYVASGFAAAGAWIRREHGIEGFQPAAWAQFAAGRRGDIFDAALSALGVAPSAELVADLVAVYRDHRPDIGLAADAAAWLDAAPDGVRLALLTDGPAASQANKIAALGLAERGLWPLVMTGSLGEGHGKPHPLGYTLVETAHGHPPGCFTYVADNAAKDFVTPRSRGWRTVQIVRAGRLHASAPRDPAYAADTVITSLHQLCV